MATSLIVENFINNVEFIINFYHNNLKIKQHIA